MSSAAVWTWIGFANKYSWIPETFSGQGDALLWDANFNKKPAYTIVSSMLAAAATGSIPTTTLTPTVTSSRVTVLVTVTTSSRATTTTAASGAEQVRWGQCGGNGWTGPTQCQSLWTCTKQNDFNTQCL
ncbi:endo-1,4-beta-xylanase 1 [Colletotrichum spaethianum]|uniref:Endo-1,4-beta-xylanase 1 n=1 Tax=Colletotrichum spaethianum TaxID=700344 RepID=A0AA37P9L7_9PEZI|nr:endo-1,4-beta-xylanase 1 [Colletotrichum spaethianum]GKT48186.1 endo-1,4-beta-xylanase 1 [Colletotrichum spaethianum]